MLLLLLSGPCFCWALRPAFAQNMRSTGPCAAGKLNLTLPPGFLTLLSTCHNLLICLCGSSFFGPLASHSHIKALAHGCATLPLILERAEANFIYRQFISFTPLSNPLTLGRADSGSRTIDGAQANNSRIGITSFAVWADLIICRCDAFPRDNRGSSRLACRQKYFLWLSTSLHFFA